jgi:hypothetical protein
MKAPRARCARFSLRALWGAGIDGSIGIDFARAVAVDRAGWCAAFAA